MRCIIPHYSFNYVREREVCYDIWRLSFHEINGILQSRVTMTYLWRHSSDESNIIHLNCKHDICKNNLGSIYVCNVFIKGRKMSQSVCCEIHTYFGKG